MTEKINTEIDKYMKYGLSFQFHVVFWVVMQIYYFYSMNFFGLPFEDALYSKLFYLPFQLSAAYFMLFVLLGAFLYNGKYIKAIVGFIVFIFLFSYLAFLFREYIYKPYFNPGQGSPDLGFVFLDLEDLVVDYMRVIFLSPLILICLEFSVSQYQKMKDVEALLAQKKKAELNLLKTQIHPGFLLSTLRNLEKLTETYDNDGPIVIEKLSEILDFILYKGRQEKIEIGQELAAIEVYVALENIRFKGCSKIILDIFNGQKTHLISPLILFSFIELNFKNFHALNFPFLAVNILVDEREGAILCVISNTKKQKEPIPKGYEINEMRRQLEISYPGMHHLEIENNSEYYMIKLEIKL